ncbi:MAG TPA: PD-(D/E)XK nuclease family protein [Bryobacteraceae bacterium]|nr:PD-(D/E)XK nuclease family protein [Bryobacteraceae bacterium]
MKLVRGAPGSGKTRQVFAQFKEAVRGGGENLRIVVPTATLVRHFQHELARDGFVFPPRSIISLNRFIAERAALAQPDAKQIPDGLLRILVADALQRLKFPEFAAVEQTAGMADTIIETIELFENAGCTPEKLAAVRKLGGHAKPFERIWRAVGDSVRQCGYLTRAGMIRAANETVESARIWLDGFLNFSPIEQEFVGHLARTCEVTLAIADSLAAEEMRRFALRLGAEDNLLRGGSRKPPVIFASARTVEREADEIARRILTLHERGAEFREMAVAMRDASVYVPLLKGTFERFGIPARFYFSSPLRDHPAAIFLGGLISGALNGWDFESAIATLRAHPLWGAHPDFDRFDFVVREAMPGRGAADILKLCEVEWLRDEIAACLKIESWKDELHTPAEWVRRLQSLAESVYRPGMLEVARDRLALEAARSHAAGVRAWIAAIAPIRDLAAKPFSLMDFWRAATLAVESASVYPIDDRVGTVHVMSVWEARQWNVPYLFVCGLTDRDFPKQAPRNLLFPEKEIERLRAAGILLRNAEDYQRDEEWLFESLRTRASNELVLSWPEQDSSGKSVQCSRLLAEHFPDFAPWTEAAPLAKASPAYAAPDRSVSGFVGSAALQAGMAGLHGTISLTALEDLAQCRFKFFGGRTLALKGPPDRPGERLQPRVTGSILHMALERWLADRGRNFVELFEETFDEACRTQRLAQGYRLEVERIQFREIAERVSANDLWTPDSSQAEVEILLEFPDGIKVKGRIDRIDRFGDDCVIVDYKSSKTANVEKLVASRTRLQGPLYALAARESMNLNPVAMIYWAVREDERYGWGKIPGYDLDELQPMPANWTTEARARTVERLSGFLAGQVHAHPEEAEQCRWCDLAAACRVEQAALVSIGGAAGGANASG